MGKVVSFFQNTISSEYIKEDEALEARVRSTLSFDVVIPTKNSSRTIENCINALFNSDVPIKNIFLIDNSQDATPEIAEKMGCVVIKSDYNYSQALRIGANLCSTNYFLILDSDIIINPKFFLRLKTHITDNFITKGTFYDQIQWKSLAKRMLSQRRKGIHGLEVAFVHRETFLKLTQDWETGYIDAGGDTQLYRRCKQYKLSTYQDPELVNLHLVGHHKRFLKHSYWYGKSGRTNRLHLWTHFPKRFLRGVIKSLFYALKYKDVRYIPFNIYKEWNYFWGWLNG